MLSSALSHHNPMGTCRSNISVNGAAWRLGLAVDVTMMQRNVTGEDVAETIFSLITSNPFVTGETIVIDGGYAATS